MTNSINLVLFMNKYAYIAHISTGMTSYDSLALYEAAVGQEQCTKKL